MFATKEPRLEQMVELTDSELDAVVGGVIIDLRPGNANPDPAGQAERACFNFARSQGQGYGPPFCERDSLPV